MNNSNSRRQAIYDSLVEDEVKMAEPKPEVEEVIEPVVNTPASQTSSYLYPKEKYKQHPDPTVRKGQREWY